MQSYMDTEARFLHADSLIVREEIAEAKEILEGILEDEPDYGRAHSHLGWILRTRLNDFERAAYHLRLAVKFAPDFTVGYLHYARILAELGEWETLEKVAQKALRVKGMVKADVFHFLALAKEMTVGPREALKYLEKAKDAARDEEDLDYYLSEIRRVKSKMNAFSRIALLF